MSVRRALLPEAAEELLGAAEWYEVRRPGLGVEFVGAIEAANAVESSPLAGAAWPRSVRYRRWVMDRFPFILIYENRSEAIEFIAIAHGRRMPGYRLARVRPPPSPST